MRNIVLFILIAALFGCGNNDHKKTEGKPAANINGEQLFKENCASCHKCLEDFTGPALKGALQRWGGDKALLHEFVRSPFSVIQKNDYAKNLQKKFGGAVMTPFPFSDEEIDAILEHCSAADPAPTK